MSKKIYIYGKSALASVFGLAMTPSFVAGQEIVPELCCKASASSERIAALRAITKATTDNPGEDEYAYGLKLWEEKFYPEAEQVLQLFISKYPKHTRISYGRNLLGRAFLDDGKPREAASWFLKDYQADAYGARAAGSLLYLGEAMWGLKDGTRACIALREFTDTYKEEASGRLNFAYRSLVDGITCPANFRLSEIPARLLAPKPAPEPSPDANAQPLASSDIDEAKRKCADLGFVRGTPKFGQCVLKVSE